MKIQVTSTFPSLPNIHNFSATHPMNYMTTKIEGQDKIRSPPKLQARTGPWIFQEYLYSVKNDTPVLFVSIDHFSNSAPNELFSSLCPWHSLPLTDLSPCWCRFLPAMWGDHLSCMFSYSVGFFFFTEILEQIEPVSTDLWEICHVSSFKQVV